MPARRDRYGYRTGTPTDEFNRRRREQMATPLGRPGQQPTLPSDRARQPAQQQDAAAAFPRMAGRRTASPQTPTGQAGLHPGQTRAMSGRVQPPAGTPGMPTGVPTGPIGGMSQRPASTLAPGQFYAEATRGGTPATAQPGAQPGTQPGTQPEQPKFLWHFQSRIRHPQTGERSVLQDAAREDFSEQMLRHFTDSGVQEQLKGAQTLQEYDEVFREQGREAGMEGHVDAQFMNTIMERYEKFMPAEVRAEYDQQRKMERSRAQAERTLEAMPEGQREGLAPVLDPGTGQFVVGPDPAFAAQQEQQAEIDQQTQQLQDNPWMAPDMMDTAERTGTPIGNETWQSMPARARQIAFEQAMRDLPNAMQGSPVEQARVQAFEERYGMELGVEMPEQRLATAEERIQDMSDGIRQFTGSEVIAELENEQGELSIERFMDQPLQVRQSVSQQVGPAAMEARYGYNPDTDTLWNVGVFGTDEEVFKSFENPEVRQDVIDRMEKFREMLYSGGPTGTDWLIKGKVGLRFSLERHPELKKLPLVKELEEFADFMLKEGAKSSQK